MTIKSARRVLSLVAVLSGCLGLFGCGFIPIFGGLTGLPTSITIPASVVLTATVGGTINVANSYIWTFSTTCGGTFSSTTTPNNGPANPLTIGPVALSPTTPIQVTYNSTGATPGTCTLTVQLMGSGGPTTRSFTVTLLSGFIHIYWANNFTDTIGRANLDGTGANQSFISGASGLIGVAVDSAHIYWTNFSTNTIGRANLDGTGVNQSFITGANHPTGVAVGP